MELCEEHHLIGNDAVAVICKQKIRNRGEIYKYLSSCYFYATLNPYISVVHVVDPFNGRFLITKHILMYN